MREDYNKLVREKEKFFTPGNWTYESLADSVHSWMEDANSFKNSIQDTVLRDSLLMHINELRDYSEKLNEEKEAFTQLNIDRDIDQMSVSSIRAFIQNLDLFLSKYPKSIQRDRIFHRKQQAYATWGVLIAENKELAPDTVRELQNIIDQVSAYNQNGQVQNHLYKAIADSLIKLKGFVHDKELKIAKNNLRNRMHATAKTLAQGKLRKIDAEKVFESEKNRESDTLVITYEFSGESKSFLNLFGSDMTIRVLVKGQISESPESGVTYSILNSKVVE
jgi:hypothetical protein